MQQVLWEGLTSKGELVRVVKTEAGKVACEILAWREAPVPNEIIKHVVQAASAEQKTAPARVPITFPPSRGEIRVKRRGGVVAKLLQTVGVL